MTTSVIDDYRRAFDALPSAGAAESSLETARRRAAFEAFAELGFPTRRHEDWKYTSTAAFAKTAFSAGSSGRVADGTLLEPATLSDEVARLVFVDGILSDELSRREDLPAGLSVVPVARADADELAQLAGSEAPADGLDALADAFSHDGVVVRFAADAEVPGTVHLIHTSSDGPQPSLAATRSFVIAERHARGHVVESYVGTASSLRLPRTIVSVGDGASIRHERIQMEAPGAFHIGRQRIDLARDAEYRGFNLTLGGAVSRDGLQVRLLAPGGHVDLAALYAPSAKQTFDNHTAIDHIAASCTSDQLYKGILGGAGHGVFNGRVIVHRQAQQTAAEQLNENLLLTRTARIDTKPQLEILADDVRCTHGATVGQISPDELFYMMSRAIPEVVAREMLIFGFADDVLQRVKDPTVRERMTTLFRKSFAA